ACRDLSGENCSNIFRRNRRHCQSRLIPNTNHMLSLLCARARPAFAGLLLIAALAVPTRVPAQVQSQPASSFAPQAGEFSVAGALPGDQVHPSVAINASGGYVVWQDNTTDGDGWGISAQ